MSRPGILVVDDEKGVQSALQGILRDEGFDAFAVSTGEECLSLLARRDFSVVLLDVWLPGMDGLKVLEQIRKIAPLATVVMISGHGSVESAAPTNGRVLIYGENGTGKELVAHLLHLRSDRRDRPFIEMNCAAIPEELIESELFGHVKGSFTGASEDKEGKFAQADGGTLFLDEVGDMSLKTQAKVLRVIEEQRFTPVGGNTSVKVDVRLIASTNKNLGREMELGNFREDLYYRLNVLPFQVPPLRERKEDIEALIRYFLEDFAKKYGRKPPVVTRKAMEVLEGYPWPGNVRELRNMMERLVIMQPRNRIDVFDLPDEILRRTVLASAEPEESPTLQDARERFEREFILKTLAEYRGNISRASQALGVERSNLYRKMKQLGIPYLARENGDAE